MTDLEELRKRLVANQAKSTKPTIPTNPKQQARRLKRLEALLAKMDAGKDVARRDMKSALTEEEWAEFEYHNSFIDAEDDVYGDRPAELDKYIEMLKKADFLYNARAESTPVTNRTKRDMRGRTGRKRLYDEAELAYEKALEYLNKILSTNPQTAAVIRMWLDRPCDDTPGYEPALDPTSMPRARGSRSHYAQEDNSGTKFDKKREYKRQALEEAIDNIVNSKPDS